MAFASSNEDHELREFKAENIFCDIKRGVIGQGSYGKVFVGKHEKVGFVAVKCLKFIGGEHEQHQFEKTFRREYENLLRSRHDNISTVHGYTKWPGAVGIVMQFYGGGSLRILLLDEDIELGPGLILRMATEIASGVAYIHNCGINKRLVHLDLKPENIFITPDLHCVIGDFGCARLVQLTSGSTTQLPGQSKSKGLTLYYAAPERLFQDAKPKKEQDAYSCGIMYFEMLSREQPYQSEQGFWIKIEQGLRPDCEAIQSVREQSNANNSEIVDVMERAMIRCWDQDPSQRPDMVDIRDEFQQLLSKQDPTVILQQVGNAARNMHIVDPTATHNPTVPLNQFSTQTGKFHDVDPLFGENIQPRNRTQQPPQRQDTSRQSASHAELQNPPSERNLPMDDDLPNPSPGRSGKDLSGFLLIGGHKSRDCVEWNVTKKQHQHLPKLNTARQYSTSAKVGNTVYVMGGDRRTKSCEMMNLERSDRWMIFADLCEGRQNAASAVIGKKLYLSGGHIGDRKPLSSYLIYTIDEDRWRISFNMLQPRYAHGMCSIGNVLFSVGGWDDGGQLLHSCEFRDVRVGTSTRIASLNEGREDFACEEIKGKIYAIGGFGDGGFLQTVEEYEPRVNRWKYVSPLLEPRYSHSACVIDGRIYVVGGLGGFIQTLTPVEVYDPISDDWTHAFDLEQPVYNATVVAI